MPNAILFHGTTSHFLDSIEKEGLIPFPKNRIYSFHDGSIDCFSKKSLGGVYLTSKRESAKHAADIACDRIQDGNPIIFQISVNLNDVIADEDEITPGIDQAWYETVSYMKHNSNNMGAILAEIQNSSSDHFKLRHNFMNSLHAFIGEGDERNDELLENTFYGLIRLKCAHSHHIDKKHFCIQYQSHNKFFRNHNEEFSTLEDEEDKFQIIVDKLTKHYVGYIKSALDTNWLGITTCRTLQTIPWETDRDTKIIKFE